MKYILPFALLSVVVGCEKPSKTLEERQKEQAEARTIPTTPTPLISVEQPKPAAPIKVVSANCAKFNEMETVFNQETDDIESIKIRIESEKKYNVYEQPKYEGAFAFSGTFRAEGKEGVVVEQTDGKLVLIEGVSCINGFGGGCSPGRWFNGGYVELTQRTMLLNFGRNGTLVPILKSSDVETYREDQRKWQEEIVRARKANADNIKTYNDDVATLAKLKVTHQKAITPLAAQKKLCEQE